MNVKWTKTDTVIIGIILAALMALLHGCSHREAAVSAANIREAAVRVTQIGKAENNQALILLGNAMIVDAVEIGTALGYKDVVPTKTAADWAADPQLASDAVIKHTEATKTENADNQAAKDLAGGTVAKIVGTLGGPVGEGIVGIGTLAWGVWQMLQKRKEADSHGQTKTALETSVALGRQMTVIAEHMAPVATMEIKKQFAELQDTLGVRHLIKPILVAIKAAEPVTNDDIPK